MKIGRRRLLSWHLWLGWLIGIPLVIWTVSGLVMVARPIEEVRGTDLRIERPSEVLPRGLVPALPFLAPDGPAVREYRIAMRSGVPLAHVTYVDGSQAVFNPSSGRKVTPINEAEARMIVREEIISATDPDTIPPRDKIVGATLFGATEVPLDFRQPKPVWQVRLEDGTNVYVGRDSAQIEAVRTPFWRFFDFMWGLHILDPQTREDTHHPILIAFSLLASIGAVLGCVLMGVRYWPRRRPG